MLTIELTSSLTHLDSPITVLMIFRSRHNKKRFNSKPQIPGKNLSRFIRLQVKGSEFLHKEMKLIVNVASPLVLLLGSDTLHDWIPNFIINFINELYIR